MRAPSATVEVGHASEQEWHRLAAAFGVEVHTDWPVLRSAPLSEAGQASSPRTRVSRMSTEEMDREWERPGRRIFEPEYPDGKTRITVDLAALDYRLWFQGYGRYLVSVDGRAIGYEDGACPREYRERLLFAQCLPLAAALQGFALLHASAVRWGADVVAFAGVSGAGKTGLACRLTLRGAGFVTDDVLALESGPGAPLVHPGPPMIAVQDEDESLLERGTRLGPVVGSSDKVHLSVPTVDGARPLRRLYHLESGERFEIRPLEETAARRVLSSVFAPYLTTAANQQRLVETAGRVSSHVDQFILQMPRDGDLEAAADAVAHHVSRTA